VAKEMDDTMHWQGTSAWNVVPWGAGKKARCGCWLGGQRVEGIFKNLVLLGLRPTTPIRTDKGLGRGAELIYFQKVKNLMTKKKKF
jgi:hypothetical protein